MLAFGAAPAAIALAPSAPGPVAIVAAPWAEPDAAMQAALAGRDPILAISRQGRTVVVLAESPATLTRLRSYPGVFALRGDAETCANPVRSAFAAAPAEW
jgi:hypothetical protein